MTDDEQQEMETLWRDWRKRIAEDLNRSRPARYERSETGWIDPVIGRARGRMPTDDAVVIRRAVEREVRNEETLATKRGNTLVREWFEGQRPLDWKLFGPCPILVGDVKVRLDQASPHDVLDAINDAHSKNLANYNRAELGLEGFRDLARQASTHGYEQLSLLGDLPPRDQESKAA